MPTAVSARFPAPIGWPLLPLPDAEGRLRYPDLAQSVRELIRVVLSTRPGEQLMRPSFGAGLENLLGEPNGVATRKRLHDLVEESLTRWEPRIFIDGIAVEPVAGDPAAVRVELAYRLKRTQQSARIGLTLTLAGE